MKYSTLLHEWKNYLSNEALCEAQNYKLKEAIDLIKSIPKYSENEFDLEISLNILKDQKNYKHLKNYINILIAPELHEDQKYTLSEKINICLVHAESIFESLPAEEKKHIADGEYCVFELEDDLANIIDNKDLRKRLSTYFIAKGEDAEVIYQDENLIAVKPLTKTGSIIWGRGMSDGTRERDAINGGKDVSWCTTVSNKNNMFNTYTKDEKTGSPKNNLYYIIKDISIFRGDDKYRKICLGLTPIRNRISIDFSNNTTVDANNIDILEQNSVVGASNEVIISKLLSKICNSDANLNTSFRNAITKCLNDGATVKEYIQKAKDFVYNLTSFKEEYGKSLPKSHRILSISTEEIFDNIVPLYFEYFDNCKIPSDMLKITDYFFINNKLEFLNEYDKIEELLARDNFINKILSDERYKIEYLINSKSFQDIFKNYFEMITEIFEYDELDDLNIKRRLMLTIKKINESSIGNKLQSKLNIKFNSITNALSR